jgi:hypothetical protein
MSAGWRIFTNKRQANTTKNSRCDGCPHGFTHFERCLDPNQDNTATTAALGLGQADLVSVGYKYQSDGRLLLESKQDMRKRGVPSPDEADAVALCFSGADGSPFHARDRNFRRDLSRTYENLYI